MTEEDKQAKLTRLMKLYAFARDKGNERWMGLIKTEAEKLKARGTEEEATQGEIETIFGAKME